LYSSAATTITVKPR